jgi:hypothetical protein
MPTTLPPNFSMSCAAALADPPVASKSSTTKTLVPGVIASLCISSLFVPYSSEYSTLIFSAGSLLGLRIGSKAGAQFVRQWRAENPPARFDRRNHLDITVNVPFDECVNDFLERFTITNEGGDIAKQNTLDRKIRDAADEPSEFHWRASRENWESRIRVNSTQTVKKCKSWRLVL